MKKIIASAVVMLVVSASAFAAAYTYAGTVRWNSNVESPITACQRQIPGSGPAPESKYQLGTNGWFACYYYNK